MFVHFILMRFLALYGRLANGYGCQQRISVIIKLEVYPEVYYLKSLFILIEFHPPAALLTPISVSEFHVAVIHNIFPA